MYFNVKIYFLVVALLLGVVKCQEPLLEISQGVLRGLTLENRDGGIFYGFRSIPYAQPPINELRFKTPLPADGWDGVRDATGEIPTCMQFFPGMDVIYGEEDCLYLNVFLPELPNVNTTKKPVMVFIHGGAFIAGAATSNFYGPEFLMTKDIVLVTIQYRLGAFGFFNLDDPDVGVPGNVGMKDQVLALKWVRDNIASFGGDPDNVLIFGDSAGSMSVHLHMLSPMSKGLFNKALGQSGSAILPWLLGFTNNGLLIAEQLGIQTTNLTETLASLREVSAEDIARATQTVSETGDNLFFIGPTIENQSDDDTFLSRRPIDIIQSGNYNHVPFLTGVNDLEGLFMEMTSLQTTGESILIEDFTQFVPEDLEITPGSEEEEMLAARIREFYFGDVEPSRDNIMPAVDLYSDFLFGFPAFRGVLEHLKTMDFPVFGYYFTADTSLNFIKQMTPPLQQFPGAAHGDERGYLFRTMLTPDNIEDGSVEDLAIRNMVDLWTNFAIYGDPTPNRPDELAWKPVTLDVFNYYMIGTNFSRPAVDPREENMRFWMNIYDEFFPLK